MEYPLNFMHAPEAQYLHARIHELEAQNADLLQRCIYYHEQLRNLSSLWQPLADKIQFLSQQSQQQIRTLQVQLQAAKRQVQDALLENSQLQQQVVELKYNATRATAESRRLPTSSTPNGVAHEIKGDISIRQKLTPHTEASLAKLPVQEISEPLVSRNTSLNTVDLTISTIDVVDPSTIAPAVESAGNDKQRAYSWLQDNSSDALKAAQGRLKRPRKQRDATLTMQVLQPSVLSSEVTTVTTATTRPPRPSRSRRVRKSVSKGPKAQQPIVKASASAAPVSINGHFTDKGFTEVVKITSDLEDDTASSAVKMPDLNLVNEDKRIVKGKTNDKSKTKDENKITGNVKDGDINTRRDPEGKSGTDDVGFNYNSNRDDLPDGWFGMSGGGADLDDLLETNFGDIDFGDLLGMRTSEGEGN